MKVTSPREPLTGPGSESTAGGRPAPATHCREFCPNCGADLAASRVALAATVFVCDDCLRELPPPGGVRGAGKAALVEAT